MHGIFNSSAFRLGHCGGSRGTSLLSEAENKRTFFQFQEVVVPDHIEHSGRNGFFEMHFEPSQLRS